MPGAEGGTEGHFGDAEYGAHKALLPSSAPLGGWPEPLCTILAIEPASGAAQLSLIPKGTAQQKVGSALASLAAPWLCAVAV